MEKLLIDVSEHNGKIDWETVKNYIDGAIIRCGYGMDKPIRMISNGNGMWQNVSDWEFPLAYTFILMRQAKKRQRVRLSMY